MKLGRTAAIVVLVLACGTGCGARSAKPADVPQTTSTTQLSAAELAPAEAPHVGKPQQHAERPVDASAPASAEDRSDERPKPEPRKDADRRPSGGGFSGYK